MNEELKIIIRAVTDEARKNIAEIKDELADVQDTSDKAGKTAGAAMAGMAKGAAAAVAAIAALTTAMAALGKKAQEVQKGFDKLNTTFLNAGATTAQASQTYKELFGFLGDHDKAIETAQSLALITNEEEKLAEWSTILQGAFAEMGDKLPIEGLAEAANETINTGVVVGVLADALNWAGVSEDAFNVALANTNSLSEREAMIRGTLNGLYGNSAKIYSLNNQATINYNKSQADLNTTLAKAAQYTTPLLTALNNLSIVLLTSFGPALQTVANYLTAFIQLMAEAIQWVASFFGVMASGVSEATADVEGYRNAMDSYLASLGGGFGGANAALDENLAKINAVKKATMGFDELNIVSSQASASASTGTGGGGGAGSVTGAKAPNPADYGLGVGSSGFAQMTEDIAKAKEEIKGMLPLMAAGAALWAGWNLTKFIKELGAGSKAVQQLHDLADRLGFKWKGFNKQVNIATWKEGLKALGAILLTILQWTLIIAGAVVLVYGAFKAWTDGLDWKNLLIMLGGIAALVTGLGIAFGWIGVAIGLVVGYIALAIVSIRDLIVNGYNTISAIVATVVSASLLTMINPILGIGALVVGIFAILYNEFEGFRNFVDGVWAAIKGAVNSIINFFTKTIPNAFKSAIDWFVVNVCTPIANFYNKWIAPVVNKLIEIALKLVEMVGAIFIGLWNLLKMKVIDPIAEGFRKLWEGIKEVWGKVSAWFSEKVITPVANFFKKLWEDIKTVFAPVINFFADIFQKAYNKVTEIFGRLKSFFSDLWNNIKTTFAALGKIIGDAIGSAVKTGINGIISLIEGTINRAISLINGAIDLINLLPGVKVEKLTKLTMPRLAKGGIVTKSTIANIGEAGKEAVLPLENNTSWMNVLADKIAARQATPSRIVLALDGRELGYATINSINDITKQTGKLQLAWA